MNDRELDALVEAWGPAGDCWLSDGDTALVAEDEATLVVLSLTPDGLSVPASAKFLVQQWASDGPLPGRPGTWHVDGSVFARAVRTTRRRGNPNQAIEVTATQVEGSPLLPPGRPAEDAYLSDLMRDVRPRQVTRGPGFGWAQVAFEDLNLVPDPGDDHRLVDCPYHDGASHLGPRCGYLHDWPVANPDRHSLILPDVLLSAWQILAQNDQEELWNEAQSHRLDGGPDDSSWYGLDLPGSGTLWLRVDPHPLDLAAPRT